MDEIDTHNFMEAAKIINQMYEDGLKKILEVQGDNVYDFMIRLQTRDGREIRASLKDRERWIEL